MTREHNRQFKPLSFSTTMRNPERIVDFLKYLLPFEGQKLDNNIIDQVVISLIQNKIYKPTIINKVAKYRTAFNASEPFSRKMAEEIMQKSPQKHKEAGFDKGWPSRFDTWYKLPMEFGFIFYEMNKTIKFSTTGHMLIESLSDETFDEQKIQKVFLNALMKYQTHNPFRKNANTNAPLPLLLNVIKLLKEDPEENGAGISRGELSFIICSPNNDAHAIYNQIKSLRKKYGFTYSDEVIYDICLKILGATEAQHNRFKISHITGEAVDDFIRNMRITGIVSLRGQGRFIDFNSFEKETIDYVIKKYTNYHSFETKEAYFDYMGQIDSNILSAKKTDATVANDVRQKTLSFWAINKSPEYIASELKIISKKDESKDDVLKYISKPTRLEFLTSILLKQRFPDMDIKPNYSVDDEGFPIFTAAGGMADIECFDTDNNPLIEVTLTTSRNQSSTEIPAITRHLQEARDKYPNKYVFSIFVAPTIHPDSIYMTEFSKSRYNVDIFPCSIDEFILKTSNIKQLKQMVSL